jgi:cytochrome c oxidase subunit 4
MADPHAHTHGHDHGAATYEPMYEPHVAEHASRKTYVIVGIILCVLTGIEVAVFFIHALAGILIPLLLVLSIVKFVTVVQFFMHLKYDQKMLSRVFFGPLMLACLVVVGMIMLFKVIPKFAW